MIHHSTIDVMIICTLFSDIILYYLGDIPDIHSFPTRRSSDLILLTALQSYQGTILFVSHDPDFVNKLANDIVELRFDRSEEHTSEFQSRENIVCCLLLENKHDAYELQNGQRDNIMFLYFDDVV